jgi:hypothetical protein
MAAVAARVAIRTAEPYQSERLAAIDVFAAPCTFAVRDAAIC